MLLRITIIIIVTPGPSPRIWGAAGGAREVPPRPSRPPAGILPEPGRSHGDGPGVPVPSDLEAAAEPAVPDPGPEPAPVRSRKPHRPPPCKQSGLFHPLHVVNRGRPPRRPEPTPMPRFPYQGGSAAGLDSGTAGARGEDPVRTPPMVPVSRGRASLLVRSFGSFPERPLLSCPLEEPALVRVARRAGHARRIRAGLGTAYALPALEPLLAEVGDVTIGHGGSQ